MVSRPCRRHYFSKRWNKTKNKSMNNSTYKLPQLSCFNRSLEPNSKATIALNTTTRNNLWWRTGKAVHRGRSVLQIFAIETATSWPRVTSPYQAPGDWWICTKGGAYFLFVFVTDLPLAIFSGPPNAARSARNGFSRCRGLNGYLRFLAATALTFEMSSWRKSIIVNFSTMTLYTRFLFKPGFQKMS